MERQKIEIHLDLEGTVIVDWWDRRFINIPKIRQFIRDREVNSVSIFSFAIRSIDDRENILGDLEYLGKLLGVVVNYPPPTYQNFQLHLMTQKNIKIVETIPYLDTKETMFIEWCRRKKDKTCILIDDTVVDKTLTIEDNVQIQLFNVNNL